MTVTQAVQRAMSPREVAEKKAILKALYGSCNWLRSKMVGYNVDCEVLHFGDTYRAILSVTWLPQPDYPSNVLTMNKVHGILE